MARRRKASGIELLALLPWPVCLGLGLAGYWLVRHGIWAFLGRAGGPLLSGLATPGSAESLAPLAWMLLAICWAAGVVSYFKARQRRALLDTQTGLESLQALNWREFELLVGEAFRRQGYVVDENGQGGADGGIDLVLQKDGRRYLVQCKQWKTRHVSVMKVREMWGLVDHHRADGVKLVCVGDYTPDAAQFARGKAIELITGQALLDMVRSVQRGSPDAVQPPGPAPASHAKPSAPNCPLCDSPMVLRKNRRTTDRFWGCPGYPKCRGTRPASDSR